MANTQEVELRHFGMGFPAGADLSALKYKAVKMNTAGEVVAISAITDAIYGVLQNSPTTGQASEIEDHGDTFMIVGSGGVTAGTYGTIDTTGAVVAPTTTGRVLGLILFTAAAGERTTVQLHNKGVVSP